MEPDPERASYASYLLRLRWALRDGQPVRQAMLVDVLSKEKRSFSDLEGLVAYLHALGLEFSAEPARARMGAETRPSHRSAATAGGERKRARGVEGR
jgi:hypothetical protein